MHIFPLAGCPSAWTGAPVIPPPSNTYPTATLDTAEYPRQPTVGFTPPPDYTTVVDNPDTMPKPPAYDNMNFTTSLGDIKPGGSQYPPTPAAPYPPGPLAGATGTTQDLPPPPAYEQISRPPQQPQ